MSLMVQSRRFRDAPKESGRLQITDISRQRLKHHDVTKVGGHPSHRVITTHSDHPARRRTFPTRSHRGVAGSWIIGATESNLRPQTTCNSLLLIDRGFHI